MKAFVEPLLELSGFQEMTQTAEKTKGLMSITGCIDAQKSHMIYSFDNGKKNKLIVTFNEQKAKELSMRTIAFLTIKWFIIRLRMYFSISLI